MDIEFNSIQTHLLFQAFASSITGTLATQALLKGVGVGDESATALAATITWILKGKVTLSVSASSSIVVIADCKIVPAVVALVGLILT